MHNAAQTSEEKIPKARTSIIDPEVLIAASEELGRLIEEENRKREERIAKLEETAAQLREVRAAAQQKQEEALTKERLWREEGCPTYSDIRVMKPLTLKRSFMSVFAGPDVQPVFLDIGTSLPQTTRLSHAPRL